MWINNLFFIVMTLIFMGCGSTWQVKSVEGAEYLVEDLEVNSSEETLTLMEGESVIELNLDGVKRIIPDATRPVYLNGRTWLSVRVDFEEGNSWNAPEQGLVGDQKVYILQSSKLSGMVGESRVTWPVGEVQELVLEGESFLSADSTKQGSELTKDASPKDESK